ncbi:hypothetical protein D9758_019099 [Tetrapyrgos nigripes]|uniref:Uncharacterized protein n=1 Tax=Tetrapyrgos nigripes TaxID=182062 RepID=A0A8H5APF3_9AGAR|nr:hypothetical protein D9758_019099 [Tetrapyrgos nigripes]
MLTYVIKTVWYTLADPPTTGPLRADLTDDSGWSWDSIQQYIKKNEQFTQPSDFHNVSGQFDPGKQQRWFPSSSCRQYDELHLGLSHILTPASRGFLTINSSNPLDRPVIDLNLLSSEFDVFRNA